MVANFTITISPSKNLVNKKPITCPKVRRMSPYPAVPPMASVTASKNSKKAVFKFSKAS